MRALRTRGCKSHIHTITQWKLIVPQYFLNIVYLVIAIDYSSHFWENSRWIGMIVPRLIASKEDTSYISDFSSSILKVPAATSISSEYNIKQKKSEKNERPKQLPELQNIGHLKVQKLSYKIHVCNLNVFLKHQFES